MTNVTRWIASAAVGLLFIASAQAADPVPVTTTITVSDLDCAGCAKKLVTQLKLVKGVEKAEADLKTKTVKVTPKTRVTLSPKELWEAVEKVEKTPTKLDGPGGKFTSKPEA